MAFSPIRHSISKCGMLAAAILLPAVLLAQTQSQAQKPALDSLRVHAADSAQALKPARLDSSRRFIDEKSRADYSVAPTFFLPEVGFGIDTATVAKHLFQDFVRLASQVSPLVPIITGEVGQPQYLAAGDLPARAVSIIVDDVVWIPGVYGAVDLTSLPDAYVNRLEAGGASLRDVMLAPAPARLDLAGDSLRYRMPFSRLDYAKGPFDADAVRFRFGRALSHRLAVYLNGAFGNADGRTLSNAGGEIVERPYDGHKVSVQFDYLLRSHLKLRYRHFNSRNEAGIGVPFFPEEWPGISQALHKEERLYHALELSSAHRFSLRGFYWQIKEELNDPVRQIRHRLRDGGTEIQWNKATETWALKLQYRLGFEAITSTSIQDSERFYEHLFAAWGWRLTPKLWLHLGGDLAYKTAWPLGASVAAQLINRLNPSLTWWLAGGLWKIPPAPGERDNDLPYLTSNDDLHEVTLRRGEAGLQWHRQRCDLQFVVSGSIWKDGLVFQANSQQSSGSLYNNNRQQSVFAARLKLDWEFVHRWHLVALSAQTANELPHDYWFWHQPQGYGSVYLETTKSFFDGDLEILPRLAGRFIGKRYSPSFDTTAVRLFDHTLPAAPVLDVQIRLRHGDGALLFSWENLLEQKYDWRYGVPAPRHFLRWGFWWNFSN